VVLTFDGYEDFYFEAFPHIRPFGLKPVVFLPVGRLGDWSSWDEQTGSLARKWLSVGQVRELHQQGVQFGSCGLTHAWMPGLPDEDLRHEVVESKARLEDLLGSEVTCFAYPGGGVDQRVRAAVARAGYQFGFSTRAGLNFWEDRLALKRILVNEGDTAIDLLVKLATGRSIADHLPAPLRRILRVGESNEPVDRHKARKPLRNPPA
jgi:peptidoglycan/xylan/chitin deacetylase (PgdA/CDA1 family)